MSGLFWVPEKVPQQHLESLRQPSWRLATWNSNSPKGDLEWNEITTWNMGMATNLIPLEFQFKLLSLIPIPIQRSYHFKKSLISILFQLLAKRAY